MQPSLRVSPQTLNRARRNPCDFRRLLNRQSAEETQFYNAALLRVEARQNCERFIKQKEINVRFVVKSDCLIERKAIPGGAFCSPVFARMVNEDLPHEVRGDAEEVSAVFPIRIRLVN